MLSTALCSDQLAIPFSKVGGPNSLGGGKGEEW